jgi:hypothetical protein
MTLGGGGMAVDRAVTAVAMPAQDHVECSRVAVVAEDRVLVVDLVRGTWPPADFLHRYRDGSKVLLIIA